MLHFVNQTKTDFVLKITEDDFLCLCRADDNSTCINAVQIDVTENDYDELLKSVQDKIEAEGGAFPIRANRSSKLYVTVPNVSVLYSEKFTNLALIHMFGKETGLSAKEYYYPKSAIFVITDTDYDVDVEYQDPAIKNPENAKELTPIVRAVKADDTIPGFKVSVFLSNVTKWDKVPEGTFIKISDTQKLKVSVIQKRNPNTGAEYTINALIRCDENGNEVQSHRKDQAGKHPGEGRKQQHYNGGGNGNKKNHGKKNKKKGRTKLSTLTNGAPVVNNDLY